MKIGVFGCSFVAGVWPTNYNLAAAIADKCPQHNVYDYSMGGHSMQMINYLFQKFKHDHDFNIIKVTSPGRLNFFSEYDFKNKREWKSDNFNTWEFPKEYGRHIVRMNYTSSPNSVASPYTLKSVKKLHKLLYSHINEEIANLENAALQNYLQTQADYVWGHRHYYYYDSKYHNGIALTNQFLPKFKSYVIDNGDHLNQEGINLEADWIIKNALS